MTMRSIKMQEDVPVMESVDVLVAGGGPAGVAAAFSAARLGARTMIVEQFNCLGGVATAGGHGHICLYGLGGQDTRIVGGVAYEMAERVARLGYGIVGKHDADFEVEGMKLTLEQMAQEDGVILYYHSFLSDIIVEDGKVKGAIVQSKDGRWAVEAKMVVDCTGDGDACAKAGCEFEYGDEETGHCQPMTLMFTIGGVDYGKVRAFRNGDYDLKHVWKKAQEDGFMRPFQSKIMGWWWTPTRPDQVGVNFTHINFVNSLKAADLTAATLEGRRQAYETIEVYRKYVPGMENCHMVSTPNTVGIRESRRIKGMHMLTAEEVKAQACFDDSIGYGNFFIDIHGTKAHGMDDKTWYPPQGFKYQIPYRILVPGKIDNILVAGRCASATHVALGSLRVMPQCGVMGQAAGTAAALSIRGNTTPRMLAVADIQDSLRAQGCIIDEDDIARANV